MSSPRSAALPPRQVGAIPLKGPRGVIGFIPPGAITPETHLITLEVVLTVADTGSISVPVRLSQHDLEFHARIAHPTHAVADLRQWVVERARQELAFTHPDARTMVIGQSAIYWVYWAYGRPGRREPFLR